MIALCLSLFALTAVDVLAQEEQSEPYSRLGVGGQVGVPSGLTVKYYFTQRFNVVVLNAWSVDRFLRVSSHVAFESPIPDSPLQYYLGAGLFYGRSNSSKQTNFKTGLTVVVGVNFYIEKFEVFLQANPDFALHPALSFKLGGVAGLRYFF